MGFEPTISAGERPKTYALDHAATGTGAIYFITLIYRRSMNAFMGTEQINVFSFKMLVETVAFKL